MEVMYPRCCGLDVHKSSISACVLIAQSGKPLKHIRRFGCTIRELRELIAWLQEFSVEHVAMESTGVYWKPVWNVLESHFQIVLANISTDGKMIDLGTFGGTTSEAFGINNAGRVVGYASLPNDQNYHAFVYIPGEGMLDLNTLIPSELGWVLQVARAINHKGEIVGYGLKEGKSRAFLLKPLHRK